MLTTHSLTIGYPRKVIASDLNLELHPGQMTALIGPNGAGKSTLLRTLAGMHPPLRGEVRLNGENVHAMPALTLARRLAIVLTTRVEAGNLSVYTLVSLGRHPYTDWLGRLSANDHAVIRRALELTATLPLAERPIHELSDGERQRVMIARALAQEPQVLLLDEPTAFLDLPRRVETFLLLRRLARETNCAVLLTTHDLDLALRVADQLWLLSSNGNLRVGLPEELALSGALAQTFAGEGVEFDHTIGAFRVSQPTRGAIHLHGDTDGVVTAWTWRALERIGYQVHNGQIREESSQRQVEILPGPRWRVALAHHNRLFDSLNELVAFLEEQS